MHTSSETVGSTQRQREPRRRGDILVEQSDARRSLRAPACWRYRHPPRTRATARRALAAEDEGAAVGAEAKVLLEELRSLSKSPWPSKRKVLRVYLTRRGPSRSPQLLEEEGHAVQQLGGAARLQNHLVGVDKEGRLERTFYVNAAPWRLGVMRHQPPSSRRPESRGKARAY